eukprot:COSAG01_NODE_888_length_12915_cov_10.708723_17_plen_58_part_00
MGDAPCPAPATAGLQGKRAHLLLRDQFERHGFVSGLPILTAAEWHLTGGGATGGGAM